MVSVAESRLNLFDSKILVEIRIRRRRLKRNRRTIVECCCTAYSSFTLITTRASYNSPAVERRCSMKPLSDPVPDSVSWNVMIVIDLMLLIYTNKSSPVCLCLCRTTSSPLCVSRLCWGLPPALTPITPKTHPGNLSFTITECCVFSFLFLQLLF